ncbi:MAG TPA: PAS domain S-box protein, partial [Desulfuromonadaceae bacterium]
MTISRPAGSIARFAAILSAAILLCFVRAEAAPQGKPLLLLCDRAHPQRGACYIENRVTNGLAVDFAKALSREMGRQIRIESADWQTAHEMTQKGEADGLIGLNISEETGQLYDFSKPIYTREYRLFVRDDEMSITGVSDLAGLKVAVASDGFPQAFMEDYPEISTVTVANCGEGLKLLATGRVNAVAADIRAAAYAIRMQDMEGIKIVGGPFAVLPGTIAVRKGNQKLVGEINRAIGRLEESGELTQIRDKWHPPEMVFLRKNEAMRIAFIAASLVMAAMAVLVAIWIVVLKRQVRERKNAEQALGESQTMLAQILDSVPLGIFWKDRNSVYRGCNKVFAGSLGFQNTAQVIGKTDFALPWPREEAAAYRADDREVMEHNRPKLHIEEPMQQADGTRLWVETTKVPLLNDSGNVYGVLGVCDDITDRKKNEQALRESEGRYRELVENLNVGIFRSIPTSGEVVSANSALFEIFSYDTLTEFQQLPLSAHYLHDANRSLLLEKISHDGQIRDWEVAARKKDGSPFWVSISAKATYNEDGTVRWIDGIIKDVTKRRHMQKTLSENEQRFRAIFEHSGIGIAVVDMQGHPEECNPVLLEMLGYDQEELGGMAFTNFTHPDDRELDWGLFGELIAGKRDRYQMEKRYIAKSGQVLWGHLTVSLIRDAGGEPLHCIAMVDDITELRKMREMMVQTEKMTMIAGLAAGMAHEINNPLGIVVQNLQVLERRFSPNFPRNIEIAEQVGIEFERLLAYLKRQEVFDFISGIRDAGSRASKVMTNMLQFSRKSDGWHQPVSPTAVCDQAIEMTESDYDLRKHYDFKHIAIVREYANDLPQVSVNISEIVQVMINLLKNAAQALSNACTGGKPQIRISISRHNEMIEIKVADNGPG